VTTKEAKSPVDGSTLSPEPSISSAVAEFTRHLFTGPVTISTAFDPEYDSQYFVVSVVARGDTHELVQLNDRWHREICAVAGEAANNYRLSLDVQ
jgi:hypothetical protein